MYIHMYTVNWYTSESELILYCCCVLKRYLSHSLPLILYLLLLSCLSPPLPFLPHTYITSLSLLCISSPLPPSFSHHPILFLFLHHLPTPGSCSHYTDCCDGGYCAGYPPNCFCDHDCHSRGDCCRDVGDICPECKYFGSMTKQRIFHFLHVIKY